MTNMSKNPSSRGNRVKAKHDCEKEINAFTVRYVKRLEKCREECCPEHVHRLATFVACAGLRFIHIMDGGHAAEEVLGAINDIMKAGSVDDIDSGTLR
jgi:hypothetical protein